MRKGLIVVVALVAVYAVACGGFYFAMCRGPEAFSAVMARAPDVAFAVFPLESMWLSARAGSLAVGEPAPDFSLERYDQPTTVRLSQFRGERPVVLVFGSYT